jgi:GNAT superfamily N-acetyltransferase
MKMHSCSNGEEFLSLAGTWLRKREVEHNLILGLAGSVASGSTVYESAYFGVLLDDGFPVGAVLQTPPHNLVSTRLPVGGVPSVLDWVIEHHLEIPGVVSPPETARPLAESLARVSDRTARLAMDQGLYRCDRVVFPSHVSGDWRVATDDDFQRVYDWTDAFTHDIGEHRKPSLEQRRKAVRLRIESNALLIWEDGEPVSMAGSVRETENGICVGLVYTPPELRKRGYGSAVTAAVTQRALDAGRQWTMLYTDLSNPTSNSIYLKIGYERIGDSQLWAIE